MNYDRRILGLMLLISCVSAVVIYLTGDIVRWEALAAFHLWSIVLAFVFLMIGMYFDCARLNTLVQMAGCKITLLESLTVILSNYFFAMLTPGATGGPVAQVLVLKRLGVPAGYAAVLVVVRTIFSIMFLAIATPIVLCLDRELVAWMPLEIAVLIAVGMIAMVVVGIKSVCTRRMKRAVLWGISRIKKIRRRKVWTLYRDIAIASILLGRSPRRVMRVMVDTALSLLALYAIVPALFLGLGIEVDWMTVLGRMILLNLVLYFAPTPGGSGVAEWGFVYLFEGFLPSGTVGVLAVASRTLAEYVPFAVGIFFTLRLWKNRMLPCECAISERSNFGR